MRRRTRPGHDEGGFAVIFALMFILAIGMISMLLLSQVVSEQRTTQFSRKQEQTLGNSMAGLNAGLNRLRNAVNPATNAGVVGYLPCTSGLKYGTLKGTLQTSAADTWQTDIYYLNSDPTTMTLSQVTTASLTCPLSSVPAYAYLVATGMQPAVLSAGLGTRTLHASYTFTTSNASNVGGQVTYNTTCWDAGSSPAAGSAVTFATCLAAGTPSQTWYYRPDLSVQWMGDPSAKLCLDYRGLASSPTSALISLQTCVGTGTAGGAYTATPSPGSYPAINQQYQEFATNSYWNGVGASGDQDTSICVNSFTTSTSAYSSGAVGDRLVMTKTCGGAAAASGSPGVGSGEAGGITTGLPGPTQQLVNLAYFSRCLDVMYSLPSSGLITWPCHQAPNQTKVEGNQKFGYLGPATTAGAITTVRTDASWSPPNYTMVCFESSSIATLVSLNTCASGTGQKWTMTGLVAGSYADSYTIRDNWGKCLQATQPSGPLGSIIIATCTGADDQKWNAPPGGAQTALRSIGEQ